MKRESPALPASFGKAELFDVEGIPVSVGNVPGCPFSCAAWDVSPPRVFRADSAMRNGAPVSEAEFREVVAEAHAGS